MKQSRKRILSATLAAAMLLSSVTVYADDGVEYMPEAPAWKEVTVDNSVEQARAVTEFNKNNSGDSSVHNGVASLEEFIAYQSIATGADYAAAISGDTSSSEVDLGEDVVVDFAWPDIPSSTAPAVAREIEAVIKRLETEGTSDYCHIDNYSKYTANAYITLAHELVSVSGLGDAEKIIDKFLDLATTAETEYVLSYLYTEYPKRDENGLSNYGIGESAYVALENEIKDATYYSVLADTFGLESREYSGSGVYVYDGEKVDDRFAVQTGARPNTSVYTAVKAAGYADPYLGDYLSDKIRSNIQYQYAYYEAFDLATRNLYTKELADNIVASDNEFSYVSNKDMYEEVAGATFADATGSTTEAPHSATGANSVDVLYYAVSTWQELLVADAYAYQLLEPIVDNETFEKNESNNGVYDNVGTGNSSTSTSNSTRHNYDMSYEDDLINGDGGKSTQDFVDEVSKINADWLYNGEVSSSVSADIDNEYAIANTRDDLNSLVDAFDNNINKGIEYGEVWLVCDYGNSKYERLASVNARSTTWNSALTTSRTAGDPSATINSTHASTMYIGTDLPSALSTSSASRYTISGSSGSAGSTGSAASWSSTYEEYIGGTSGTYGTTGDASTAVANARTAMENTTNEWYGCCYQRVITITSSSFTHTYYNGTSATSKSNGATHYTATANVTYEQRGKHSYVWLHSDTSAADGAVDEFKEYDYKTYTRYEYLGNQAVDSVTGRPVVTTGASMTQTKTGTTQETLFYPITDENGILDEQAQVTAAINTLVTKNQAAYEQLLAKYGRDMDLEYPITNDIDQGKISSTFEEAKNKFDELQYSNGYSSSEASALHRSLDALIEYYDYEFKVIFATAQAYQIEQLRNYLLAEANTISTEGHSVSNYFDEQTNYRNELVAEAIDLMANTAVNEAEVLDYYYRAIYGSGFDALLGVEKDRPDPETADGSTGITFYDSAMGTEVTDFLLKVEPKAEAIETAVVELTEYVYDVEDFEDHDIEALFTNNTTLEGLTYDLLDTVSSTKIRPFVVTDADAILAVEYKRLAESFEDAGSESELAAMLNDAKTEMWLRYAAYNVIGVVATEMVGSAGWQVHEPVFNEGGLSQFVSIADGIVADYAEASTVAPYFDITIEPTRTVLPTSDSNGSTDSILNVNVQLGSFNVSGSHSSVAFSDAKKGGVGFIAIVPVGGDNAEYIKTEYAKLVEAYSVDNYLAAEKDEVLGILSTFLTGAEAAADEAAINLLVSSAKIALDAVTTKADRMEADIADTIAVLDSDFATLKAGSIPSSYETTFGYTEIICYIDDAKLDVIYNKALALIENADSDNELVAIAYTGIEEVIVTNDLYKMVDAVTSDLDSIYSTINQEDANTTTMIRNAVSAHVSSLTDVYTKDADGAYVYSISNTVETDKFIAAQAGTVSNPAGTNGYYDYKVTVSVAYVSPTYFKETVSLTVDHELELDIIAIPLQTSVSSASGLSAALTSAQGSASGATVQVTGSIVLTSDVILRDGVTLVFDGNSSLDNTNGDISMEIGSVIVNNTNSDVIVVVSNRPVRVSPGETYIAQVSSYTITSLINSITDLIDLVYADYSITQYGFGGLLGSVNDRAADWGTTNLAYRSNAYTWLEEFGEVLAEQDTEFVGMASTYLIDMIVALRDDIVSVGHNTTRYLSTEIQQLDTLYALANQIIVKEYKPDIGNNVTTYEQLNTEKDVQVYGLALSADWGDEVALNVLQEKSLLNNTIQLQVTPTKRDADKPLGDELDNLDIVSPVTFRVYVSNAMFGTFEGAMITHYKTDGSYDKFYSNLVTDRDGDVYLEITVTEFSQFDISPVKVVASGQTEREFWADVTAAINGAQPAQTVMVDAGEYYYRIPHSTMEALASADDVTVEIKWIDGILTMHSSEIVLESDRLYYYMADLGNFATYTNPNRPEVVKVVNTTIVPVEDVIIPETGGKYEGILFNYVNNCLTGIIDPISMNVIPVSIQPKGATFSENNLGGASFADVSVEESSKTTVNLAVIAAGFAMLAGTFIVSMVSKTNGKHTKAKTKK